MPEAPLWARDDSGESSCLEMLDSLTIRLTFSNQLFGNVFGFMILAFLLVQCYDYYKRSKYDALSWKLLVYGLVFQQIVESAIELYGAYFLTVAQWGNIYFCYVGRIAGILGNLQPLLVAIPSVITQAFFAQKIWMCLLAMGGRWTKLVAKFVCGFISIMGFISFGFALLLVVQFEISWRVSSTLERVFVALWTCLGATADLTIATCMLLILFRAKSVSRVSETRDKISHLIRLAVASGSLNVILAVAILPINFYTSGIYGLPCFFLGKSQALSVILNLNIRRKAEARATRLSLPQRTEDHREPAPRPRNATSASPGSGLTTFGVLTTLVRPIATMFMRSRARTSMPAERDIESQHAQTDNTEENSEHVSEKSRPAEEI